MENVKEGQRQDQQSPILEYNKLQLRGTAPLLLLLGLGLVLFYHEPAVTVVA